MKFEDILLEFKTEREKEEAIERYKEKYKELKKKFNSLKNLKGQESKVEKLKKEMSRYADMIKFTEKATPSS